LAAFNHCFFKHTLSDLRKGNPGADEHLCQHDNHLCRGNTVLSAAFFVTTKGGNILEEFSHTNWATIVLGIVITGLEVGFIFAYKAGWKVNTLSVTTNAILAIVLIFVGLIGYHEPISWSKVLGVTICLVGLYFMNR